MREVTDEFSDVISSELIALRRSIEHYGGTSLSKNEARDLNKSLVRSVERMEQAARNAPKAFVEALAHDRAQTTRETKEATAQAAERVLEDIRQELVEERMKLAQAAGEARRAAWQYFGGFWVWLAAMLALGAFLGLLAAYATEAGRALLRVSDVIPYGCEFAWVGGQLVEQEDGSSFCAFWIEMPQQTQ